MVEEGAIRNVASIQAQAASGQRAAGSGQSSVAPTHSCSPASSSSCPCPNPANATYHLLRRTDTAKVLRTDSPSILRLQPKSSSRSWVSCPIFNGLPQSHSNLSWAIIPTPCCMLQIANHHHQFTYLILSMTPLFDYTLPSASFGGSQPRVQGHRPC